MPVVVECRDVRYRYGRRQALRGLSATIGPGLVGLLGPNGAGKSTLISLLATITRMQGGQITVDGRSITDHRMIRRIVGYLPQSFSIPRGEPVERIVQYAAWARGVAARDCVAAAHEAVEACGLAGYSGVKAGALSGGYRQRLGIACAVAGSPQLVLLDEPTVGIDPVHRVEIRRLMTRLAKQATVVVTTHMLEDLQVPGTKLVVVHEGLAHFQGTVEELAALGTTADDVSRPLEAGYEQCLREAR